jgi:fatty-acyl-CoA synthase
VLKADFKGESEMESMKGERSLPGYSALSPVSFLTRAAAVHGERPAVLDGGTELNYAQLDEQATRLAGTLRNLGVVAGDRVAVLAGNSRLMIEAHYGVPFAGAILVALNFRLSAVELHHIIKHSGSTLVLCDDGFQALAQEATASLPNVRVVGGDEYRALAVAASPQRILSTDEREVISLNYTSGTTAAPKGVMYHHRGAYLQALAMAYHTGLGPDHVFLWTLPMFHCNGWCFSWAVTAAGATHVCLDRPEPGRIWRLIDEVGVTHFNAAPTVLTDLLAHPDAHRAPRPITVATGGSPPSPSLLARCDDLGLRITHLYGLTETFGPVVVNQWRSQWDAMSTNRRAALKARQGVGNLISNPVRIVDQNGLDVPADGATVGEIVVQGNNLMLGYFRDPEATAEAIRDGWFHTGDLGVMYPDGYLELRDRLKDVIISGGENIQSVEVEQVIASHPGVLEAAVVARADERFGERPVAFVRRASAGVPSEAEIVEHVRARLAGFKAPEEIHFVDDLPRNATGKVQKFVLRRRLAVGGSADDQTVGGRDGRR